MITRNILGKCRRKIAACGFADQIVSKLKVVDPRSRKRHKPIAQIRRVWTISAPTVYFPPMHRVRWLGILLCGLTCVGCAKVQRTLSINSDPPGALLFMNDQEVGRTPVTRDFIWYGWYQLELRKEGYKTLKTRAEVIAPAWQWPPFDLAADFSPARLKDKHKLLFKLEPEELPPSNDEMLGRAEQLRLQLESSAFTKNPATRPVTQPSTTQATQPATTESSTEPSTEPTSEPTTTTPTTTAPGTVPAPTTQPTTKPSFL